MRACLALGLIVSALVAGAPGHAQPKDQKAPATSKEIYANLQTEVSASLFSEPMKLREFLELLSKQMLKGREMTIVIDDEAYREELPDIQDIAEVDVRVRGLSAKTTVLHVLRQALKQLPAKSALIVRAGRVDIVPAARTSKEWMLNQTFNVDFKDRPLEAALEELSELTGVSIVMDARAKEKAKSAVSARFRDDVALQDAVRMLTDMAELKIVYLVTGMFITTPEHAQTMQKELKALYGVPSAPIMGGGFAGGAGFGAGPGFAGGVGMVGMVGVGPPPDPTVAPPDAWQSPLAPPLPPALSKRKEGAQ